MPKVKGPLLSFDARGQFGKSMIFTRGGVVRNYFVPRNPNTPAQQAVRQAFKENYVAGLTQEQADLLYAALVHLHDHGAMNGLDDDDHPQYLTEERGDDRYVLVGEVVRYVLPFTAKSTASISGSVNLAAAGLPPWSIYPASWSMCLQTGTTNNSSNYFWAELRTVNGYVLVGRLSTQGLAPNTVHLIESTELETDMELTREDYYSLVLTMSRVGSASALAFWGTCLEYRLTPP